MSVQKWNSNGGSGLLLLPCFPRSWGVCTQFSPDTNAAVMPSQAWQYCWEVVVGWPSKSDHAKVIL